jgi:peptidyl-prolyl cis-trans isomerase SurA
VTLILAVCLAAVLGAVPGSPEVVDRIVAEVNDEIITMSELEQMARVFQAQAGLNPKSKEALSMKREMLEALIDRKLAKAEAKRRGINVAGKEVDQAVEEFKKRNRILDDAALNEALGKMGMALPEMRQQIADQIQQERLVQLVVGAKKTPVSEAEVRRFYEANFKEGGGGQQVHLQMMNMPFPPGATAEQKAGIQKTAEVVLNEYRRGQPLAEIQRKHSLTSQDLGFMNPSDLDPKLAEILAKLKPGELVPIETPNGFQLIILKERRVGKGKPQPFEEVAPEIRRMLAQKDLEKHFMEWVKTLREKAHIKIML